MADGPLFEDREDAGRRLTERLGRYQGGGAVVFAIPRGGVPVAIQVAAKLGAAFDIIVTRKIPIPGNTEAGYGAVTEDGAIVLNQPLVWQLGLTEVEIQAQAAAVRAEIARRSALYRAILPAQGVEGKTVIIIDDGLASGFTMMAAVESLKRRRAARTVVAVPTASGSAYDRVAPSVDELVSLAVARTPYFAVASFYRNWYDLSDEEVTGYLEEWRLRQKPRESSRPETA